MSDDDTMLREARAAAEALDPRQAALNGTPPTPEVRPPPDPPPEPGDDLYVDVAALLAGGTPDMPKPILCRRDDDAALFYAAAVNLVFGDPECGKTWLCLAACSEALAEGRHVLVIDADHNGAAQIVARLRLLGVAPDVLGDRDLFRLVEPEDAGHLLTAVHDAADWRPAVAVVDSVGEVLPLLGLSSSNPDDYTHGSQKVFRPLAAAGAAVLVVDHLAQSSESRRMGPTGTLAKRRAVTGVSLRVTLNAPFTPEVGGSAYLRVHKDRAGAVREVCPPPERGTEQRAGVFALEPHPSGGLSWRITDPNVDVSKPAPDDDIAEVDGLPDDQRSSLSKVQAALGWRRQRASDALREWRRLREVQP